MVFSMCLNCKHKYVNVRASINNLCQGSHSSHTENLYSTVNTYQKTFPVPLALKPGDNQSIGNNFCAEKSFQILVHLHVAFHLTAVTPSVAW